jgi:hypothetical protein
MPGRSVSGGRRPAVEDSVNWLRNNELKPEDVNEPTLTALTNLEGAPMPKGKLTPTQKKKAIDDAMNC